MDVVALGHRYGVSLMDVVVDLVICGVSLH